MSDSKQYVVNPITGRKIVKYGKVYNRLCIQGLLDSSSGNVIQQGEPERKPKLYGRRKTKAVQEPVPEKPKPKPRDSRVDALLKVLREDLGSLDLDSENLEEELAQRISTRLDAEQEVEDYEESDEEDYE